MLVPGAAGGLDRRKVDADFDVMGRGRTVGRVFVVAPFGRGLVRTISKKAHLPDDRLGFLLGHRLDVEVDEHIADCIAPVVDLLSCRNRRRRMGDCHAAQRAIRSRQRQKTSFGLR